MPVTPNSMRMKFPEFEGDSDADLQNAIDEASVWIDSSWLASNSNLAVLYRAAHIRMVAISREEGGQGLQLKSERAGPMSIEYQQWQIPTTPLSLTDLTTTPYGVRWIEMAQMNFPSVAVI